MASFKDSALSAMRIAICTQVDVCCPSRFSRQRVYFSFTFSGVFCLIHVASSSIVNQTPLKWPSPRITPTTTRVSKSGHLRGTVLTNFTTFFSDRKDHRNGIHRPKKFRTQSWEGVSSLILSFLPLIFTNSHNFFYLQVDQKLLRNMRFARKGNKTREELVQLEQALRQQKK